MADKSGFGEQGLIMLQILYFIILHQSQVAGTTAVSDRGYSAIRQFVHQRPQTHCSEFVRLL